MMETYEYKDISAANAKYTGVSWRPLLRQILVASSAWCNFFVAGLCLGSPTVVIPQLRKEYNSTDAISDDLASWLSTIYLFSDLPWFIVLPFILRLYGRKFPFLIVNVAGLIGFIVMYFSVTVTHLIVSEVIHGILFSSTMTLSITIITEYTSPRYRGVCLTIKSASFSWGIWFSNAIGAFTYWKNIALFGIVCSVYGLVATLMSPESPIWLASKGRFQKCTDSHRWLKGYSEESEAELNKLLNTYNITKQNKPNGKIFRRGTTLKLISSITFWRPVFLCFCLTSLHHLSGKFVCTVYAIDIIKKITSSDAAAYRGMLILDGASVVAMYIGCFISRYLKRRLQLLIFSSISILFLFILSFYLFMIKFTILIENVYISILLLFAFSVAICCGPMILASSIYAELLPLKGRNLSVCLTACFASSVLAIVLKIAPFLFKLLSLAGTFLFYAVSCSCSLLILYKYLPETKGKTLQEIQDILNG